MWTIFVVKWHEVSIETYMFIDMLVVKSIKVALFPMSELPGLLSLHTNCFCCPLWCHSRLDIGLGPVPYFFKKSAYRPLSSVPYKPYWVYSATVSVTVAKDKTNPAAASLFKCPSCGAKILLWVRRFRQLQVGRRARNCIMQRFGVSALFLLVLSCEVKSVPGFFIGLIFQ